MHIVKFSGGLGNQLFQYALYLKFNYMGYEVAADLCGYADGGWEKRPLQLSKLGIEIREASIDEIKSLYCNPHSTLAKAIVKRIGKKTYYYQKGIGYDRKVFDIPNGYFHGYWQSEEYFREVSSLIKSKVVYPTLDGDNGLYYEKIHTDGDSVSIHIRLGDYLENNSVYGGICTKEYYHNAIALIEAKIETPHYYVFSNDIESCKEMFSDRVCTFVQGNDEDSGFIDLILMSQCRHHIIANSSFSWWGAWLGENERSLIVAPKSWINGQNDYMVVPERWNRV